MQTRLSPTYTATRITEVCEDQWVFDYAYPVTVCFEQVTFLWKDVARITGRTINVNTLESVSFQKGYEGPASYIIFSNNTQWVVKDDFDKLNKLFIAWNSQLSSVFVSS